MNKAKNYALIIGIADYQNTNKLPVEVINDAQSIYDVLVDPRYCAYPEKNVTLLTDASATRSAIEEACWDLADDAKKDSSVLIFFSGHGGFIPSGEHEGAYLLPVDVTDETPETMSESAISGKTFTRWLRDIPAQQVLVAFDSCHAAGAGEIETSEKTAFFKTGLSEEYYQRTVVRGGVGRAIIASSRESEYSWVTPGDHNSLFTKHLLKGLRGEAAHNDGYVRVFHLFEYLQPRVTAEKAIQHPVFKCNVEENFPVAFNEVHKAAAPPVHLSDGFEFDVYISCLAVGSDQQWVESVLAPRLQEEKLKFGLTYESDNLGLPRIVDMQRAMQISRRTLVMLSDEYLQNHEAEFGNVMAQSIGVKDGQWRVIPIRRQQLYREVPMRLDMLSGFDLTDSIRSDRRLDDLMKILKKPVSSMESQGKS